MTLISLVHIPEGEISSLKSVIGTSEDTPNVVIVNWPAHKDPGTRADLYRIFQVARPNITDVDEGFVLFLDIDRQTGNNVYHILRAHQRYSEALGADDVVKVVSLKEIKVALEFWHIIFNPFERGGRVSWDNGARVNPILNNWPPGSGRSFEHGPYSDIIPNPDKFVFGRGSPVFILQKMSDNDLRVIQSYLSMNDLSEPVLYDVSKHIQSPDMEGLVAFFESEEFGQEPPTRFIAVDNMTLDTAQQVLEERHRTWRNDVDESHATIFACQDQLCLEFQDDVDEIYATVCLGYAYGQQDPWGAISTWNNLDVGNMYFWECIPHWAWVNWTSAETWLNENPIVEEAESDKELALAGAYYPGNEELTKPEVYD